MEEDHQSLCITISLDSNDNAESTPFRFDRAEMNSRERESHQDLLRNEKRNRSWRRGMMIQMVPFIVLNLAAERERERNVELYFFIESSSPHCLFLRPFQLISNPIVDSVVSFFSWLNIYINAEKLELTERKKKRRET